MKRFYIGILLLLSGCKVGPDYTMPDTKMPTTFAETKKEKTFVPSDEELVAWWNRFEDPFLDNLLKEAVSGNFDYRIALEQVAQSRSQYWVQFTQILPEIEFDAQASRFRTSRSFASQTTPTTGPSTTSTSSTMTSPGASGAAPTTTTSTTTATTSAAGAKISSEQNFFQLGFDAIWEIDLFGKLTRAADAAYDTYEAVSENSLDVKITVLSEVANTYTLICSSQEKVALQTQVVNSDELSFTLASDRFRAGINSEQEVESARATLETDKASLKVLQTEMKRSIYSLSVLLGKNPETVLEDFMVKHPIPLAQGKVPAGLPAELLKRRHDIRSAERQLAAATEQVGVAVAQLYPSLSLTGSSSSFAANPLQGANVGLSSDKLNKLFKNKSRIWGIGAIMTVPVFDFGKRLAGIDVEIALQNQASLFYQKTVISALQEVEIALATYFDEVAREESLKVTADANKRNYDFIISLFCAGLTDESQVSQAKNMWLSAESSHVDSQQALATDLIAVYKSLGGSW